jgi:hypothetical protein
MISKGTIVKEIMMTDKQNLNLPRLDSDNEDERISAILIPDLPFEIEEDEYVELPESSMEMLAIYHNFLFEKIPVGLKMKGREDLGYFAWEERFSWGGDPKEYAVLTEQFASFNDRFHFVRLVSFSEDLGLMAEVKRISDQKIFQIPLVDLKGCTRKTIEHQLVEDYSSWFVNFGPLA